MTHREGPRGRGWITGADVSGTAAFLRAVPILSRLSKEAIDDLATLCQLRVYAPGSVVMHEGDMSDVFHIVRSGRADVSISDRTGIARVVGRLGVGSYCGEIGLLADAPRSATITVRDDAPLTTMTFDAQVFHSRLAQQVLVFRVQRRLRDRSAPGTPGFGRLRMTDLDIFEGITRDELALVMEQSEEMVYAAGSVIVQQGDVADRFYILMSGEAEVDRDGETIARLAPGDFFGETALLMCGRRTASVYAVRPSVAWSIGRMAFQRVMCHYLLTDEPTRAEVFSRIGATPLERLR